MKEEYITSNVEVEEVDWRMVVLYLAVTVEKTELIKEGIYHLTARRSTNVRGRRPTVRTPKVSGPLKKEERRNREETEEGRDLDMDGEDVPRIGEMLDLEVKIKMKYLRKHK